uniref:Uncharacterized protein n=1 Tax=Cacopsylla melanoneura TaxID=428564 RepID=A0A8D8ZA89_9HEMI
MLVGIPNTAYNGFNGTMVGSRVVCRAVSTLSPYIFVPSSAAFMSGIVIKYCLSVSCTTLLSSIKFLNFSLLSDWSMVLSISIVIDHREFIKAYLSTPIHSSYPAGSG